ncbi:hypothetical protein ONE63_003762 [Megalurothrips usitatus]|uniref:Alanine--tRNA ligase n=1 Tax=Megalurothrips usitatus TaxID=439358 RepID=A0AAV7X899_9NEOP|nr:hypothetical protein ONE63_003762 [Megalurothrips usitatus]
MLSPRCTPKYCSLIRCYSNEPLSSSSAIRNRFIDYFVTEKNHNHIRSCSLKPINGALVNAGLVQFKSVLQGQTLPPAPQVANSQKCARIGGMYNDFDFVGTDGYHHTFFEMLGNWSFGICDKQAACKLAWELLTQSYGLHPKRLYVTYFGGDSQMELKPDFETREIWRQLNVEESHILPFGRKENFWEMDLVGPCGPCTEIHVDRIPERNNAGERVNAGFPDLTELWNIVFIQFHRNADGSLHHLNQTHVDCGMGLERLVAVLNGVESNYDTDLFRPLIGAIQKATGCPPYSGTFDPTHEAFHIDQAYRILCDHARLLTVALADSVLPHNEYQMHRVLRRSLNVASDVMKKDEKLLVELSNLVSDSLHPTFPEVGENLSKVQTIIQKEAEIYKAIKQVHPKSWVSLRSKKPDIESLLEFGSNRITLSLACKKMGSIHEREVTPAVAFPLFRSLGLSAELIGKIAILYGKKFNVAAYENYLHTFRNKEILSVDSPINFVATSDVPRTNYQPIYECRRRDGQYNFPSVSAKILSVLVREAEDGVECGVILDRTNFYHTAGGQECDSGKIVASSRPDCYLMVKRVAKVGDCIIHFGKLKGCFNIGDNVVTQINESNRVGCMRNHTLAHLIHAEMQNLFAAAVQKRCVINSSYLKINYFLYGEEFTIEHAKLLENAIMRAVEDGLQVERRTVNVWELPIRTTFVPDETYPLDNISVIDIKRENLIISREACSGTHVQNTKDIGQFCITQTFVKENVRNTKETCIFAITGSDVEEAISNSEKMLSNVNNYNKLVLKMEQELSSLGKQVDTSKTVPDLQFHIDEMIKLKNSHNVIRDFVQDSKTKCSFVTYRMVAAALNEGSKKIHQMAKFLSALEIRQKIKNSRAVSHVIQLSELLLETGLLKKYTKEVHVPIMLFAPCEDKLSVCCSIPEDLVSKNFNALLWINKILPHLVESDEHVAIHKSAPSLKFQTLSVDYKFTVPTQTMKERCWKASQAAYKLANRFV